MDALTRIVDARIRAMPTPRIEWGLVVSVDPLRISLAGETLPSTPATLRRVSLGDRVLVVSWARQVVVVGVSGSAACVLALPSGTVSVPSGFSYLTGWTVDARSTLGMAATSGVVTIPSSGLYEVALTTYWGSDSVRRFAQIESSTEGVLVRAEGAGTGYISNSPWRLAWLPTGSTVRPQVWAASGTDLRPDRAPCTFSVRRVG